MREMEGGPRNAGICGIIVVELACASGADSGEAVETNYLGRLAWNLYFLERAQPAGEKMHLL